MQNVTDQYNVHRLTKQANELHVLNSELISLSSSAKVYQQLGSGGVLFLANKASLVKKTQGDLADVQQKLKEAKDQQSRK